MLLYTIKMCFNNKNSFIWENKEHPNYKNYIIAFWVGLLEGDGSIQVNHWRSKCLQFRMVIKLKNTPSNERLLQKIQKVIKGKIQYDKKGFILWVENDRVKIEELVFLLEKYPPITTKSICQLNFLIKCLNSSSIDDYFEIREQKYEDRHLFVKSSKNVINLPYFKPWLSGFIEAEGCWTLREKRKGSPSFSIGQKNDFFILESMKYYFEVFNVKIKDSTQISNFYSLEFWNLHSLKLLKIHCQKYPLLGEKYNQFINFYLKHPRNQVL